jgi:hypothetical protein
MTEVTNVIGITFGDISHVQIFCITPRACRSVVKRYSAFLRVRVLTYENDTNRIRVPLGHIT